MSGALAVTAAVAPSGVGATAAAASAATTALKGALSTSSRAGVRVRKRTKLECEFPVSPPVSGSFGLRLAFLLLDIRCMSFLVFAVNVSL